MVEVSRTRLGDPEPRGRYEVLLGGFELREGLPAPGDLPLDEAFGLVVEALWRQAGAGTVSDASVRTHTKTIDQLRRFAAARGAARFADLDTDLVAAWVNSRLGLRSRDPKGPASLATRQFRRSTARLVFRTAYAIGVHDRNPAAEIVLPIRAPRYVDYSLTDADIERCRTVAYRRAGETRLPAALALALAGASTSEIAAARVGDVRLGRAVVWLHDGDTYAVPRWARLDEWAAEALRRRIAVLAARAEDPAVLAGTRLVYTPRHDGVYKRSQQAAACNAISAVLRLAGLADQPGRRPTSITEWVARRVFAETGRVEAVAARLGMISLDAAAHLVGHDWRREPFTVPAPDTQDQQR